MTARPRLVRSIPYWALIVGSVAAGGVGLWLTLDKLGVMTSSILDGSATGVEVYAGQSWAVLGSVLIGAGLIGLAFALTLAVAASLVKRDEPLVIVADTLDDGVDEVEPGPNGTVVVDGVTADEAAVQADPAAVPGEQVAPPKN
ncbi:MULTISPECIES: dinucleotide-utilizing enzyme [unclassified Microbacterium]|uniref:dinucleotide-utilizing enzyme n=1 Tax=unclassified Microbacterium TaxID=2609290 RepID=UPI000C2C66DB|nr:MULTISPECIES: dinucleotide-utilizing enzyme [unclassified Microbacterium]